MYMTIHLNENFEKIGSSFLFSPYFLFFTLFSPLFFPHPFFHFFSPSFFSFFPLNFIFPFHSCFFFFPPYFTVFSLPSFFVFLHFFFITHQNAQKDEDLKDGQQKFTEEKNYYINVQNRRRAATSTLTATLLTTGIYVFV